MDQVNLSEFTDAELTSFVASMTNFLPNQQAGLLLSLTHGFVFFFLWTILGLFQIASARYMKHRWETNMVLHGACGSLIFGATMFWGFWAMTDKTITPLRTEAGVLASKLYLAPAIHSYSGIMVNLIVVPVFVTGLIPYVRRW